MENMNGSRYLAAASQQAAELAKLNDEQRKIVDEQLAIIKGARRNESNAIRQINKDVQDKKLSQPEAIIEKAQVNAEVLLEVQTAEATIRKYIPSFSESLTGKAKELSDKASHVTVKGADKLGEGLGAVLHTPYQAGSRLFGKLKQRVNRAIR